MSCLKFNNSAFPWIFPLALPVMNGGGENMSFLCSTMSAWSFFIRFAYEVREGGALRLVHLYCLLLSAFEGLPPAWAYKLFCSCIALHAWQQFEKTTKAPWHHMPVLFSALLLLSACGESVVLRCDAVSQSEPETAQVPQAPQAVQALFMWCHNTLPAKARAHAFPTVAIIPLPTSPSSLYYEHFHHCVHLLYTRFGEILLWPNVE